MSGRASKLAKTTKSTKASREAAEILKLREQLDWCKKALATSDEKLAQLSASHVSYAQDTTNTIKALIEQLQAANLALLECRVPGIAHPIGKKGSGS